MRANIIRDGSLEWGELPDPIPGDHELLVEVRAAGVNAADVMQLRGAYPAPPGSPKDIPGLEFTGVVIGTGAKVSSFIVGDRVMALVGGGAHAELATVDQGSAVSLPERCSWAAAGGFPEAFTTAWDALVSRGQLTAGERVLVTGASGGVGTAAVQIAARLGAGVIASTRHPEHTSELVSLGAAEALNPAEALRRGPFDLVLELVGGSNVAEALSVLAPEGRIAVIGLGAGRTTELDLSSLMAKRARIFGSTLRARSLWEKAVATDAIRRHVLPLLGAGRLRIPIAATFPLERARDGYDHLVQGGKFGKIVLMGKEGPI
ncbi:MAG TPA: NAD(P)H-quinone oxidoreductase [Candidatus Dormibacteraeota bacterium]|nr:NAD(P)H-quinone oxidoreductase [Candidatus Dormibacteraeota bacterium]